MIKKYVNEIYPRRLWVLGEDDFDKFRKEFRIDDGEGSEIDENALYNKGALTIRCYELKSRELGCAIILRENWDYTLPMILDIVAHEACHATIHTSSTLGVGCSDDNSEPFCYLIGFYARCIGHYIQNEMNYKVQKHDSKVQEAAA